MGLNSKGEISVVVLVVMLAMLLSASLMLHQLNRMTQANAMYYNMNQARNLALALEEKFLQIYENEIGRNCGELNNKNYIVDVSEKGKDGYAIFIVVEYKNAIYTIHLEVDLEGVIRKRLDNVPKGDLTCW